MSLDILFTVSSIYMALVGLGLLIFPDTLMAGALASSSLVLIDVMRGCGGGFLGVAVMDWLARSAEASKARDAIVLGNTIGFISAAVFGVFSVIHGYYPVYGWVLVVINALLAVGFFITGMSSMSSPAPTPVKASPAASKPAARQTKSTAKRRK